MMMISLKKILTAILTVALFLALPVMAQEPIVVKRSNNKVVLEGKIYYVHIVKRGHTLYSIAKAYNVSEKEIVIENPGASADLIIGQVLKIPSDPRTAFEVNTGEFAQKNTEHIIKEGETIYSISRKYNCKLDEIIKLNPGLEINDIPIGSAILLPGPELELNELSFDEQGFIFHKVKRGETLNSISRYYGVAVSELRSVNVELRWGGPHSGDVIRIPKANTALEETFRQDTLRFDSISIISDSIVDTISYNYDELLDLEESDTKMYRIAYLIPFEYSKMEPLDTLLKDVRSAIRRERITEDYFLELNTPKSINFLEFLEGSLLAIDSITDVGLQVDVHVYDTKNSMSATRQILALPELKEMDLIIGPFFPYNLELVNDFSRQNKIPLVSPFYANDSLLFKNPYLFQAVASPKTEYKHNAAYIGRLYDSNLILVHNGDSSSLMDIEYYKSALFNELEKYSALESVLLKEVILGEGDTDELIQALKPDCKNIIILPATDEAIASRVASIIYYELANFDIQLFGSSYWVGFDDIEISYIHALNLIISHSKWNDYNDPKFLHFLKKYRKNYYEEPSSTTRRGCNYGIVGYDLSLYFLSALNQFGSRFILHLDEIEVDGTLRNYRFERISSSGGYSNVLLNYYFFNDELDVVEVDLPEKPPLHQYLRPAGDDPIYYQWSEPQVDTADYD